MLSRPFGPFTIRPVKKPAVRRSPAVDVFDELAALAAPSVKAVRKPIKAARQRERIQLRVVDRPAVG